jgi:hypothetical protein
MKQGHDGATGVALDGLAAKTGDIFPILFRGFAETVRGDSRRVLDDAHALSPLG